MFTTDALTGFAFCVGMVVLWFAWIAQLSVWTRRFYLLKTAAVITYWVSMELVSLVQSRHW